jgi:predicted RNA polymerase sigma factor
MLLTDARRAARSSPSGALVPLDQQDLTLWDRTSITEGAALVSQARSLGNPGPYQVQAAIAALHDQAPSTDETDWAQIVELYELLQRMADSPMVRLSHAVATAMVEGAAAGLERLDALAEDPRLKGHHRLDSVRAHLLERAGEADEAVTYFRRAAERTTSLPERDYLLAQVARLTRG